MGYASRAGRASTSSTNPRAFAVCDRCGIWHNHDQLTWQMDWAGAQMINKRLLVCQRCLDEPQSQLRSITLPPDPVPIRQPRPENFLAAETDYRVTSSPEPSVYGWTGIPVPDGDFRITEDDDNRVTQQTGFASGSLNDYPGTDQWAPGNDDPGLPRDTDEVPIAGLYPWIPYPPPEGFHWEFVFIGLEVVTYYGLPVVILVAD